MELNKTNIKKAKPGDTLRCNVVAGLHMYVKKTHRSFFLYYRTKGPGVRKERRPKLGDWPVMDLKTARERAKAMLLEVMAGNDPVAIRAHQRTLGTCEQLFNAYIDQLKEGSNHQREVRRALSANVSNLYGEIASTVDGDLIGEALYDVLERGKHNSVASRTNGNKTMYNRLRSYLHAAFNFGLTYDRNPKYRGMQIQFDIKFNPVAGIPRDPDGERVGQRFLSFDEVKTFWQSKAIPPHQHAIFKLILATGGQRVLEVARMRTDAVDLDRKVWEIADTKNGTPHVVPLNDLAISIIESQMPVAGKEYLFTHHGPLYATRPSQMIQAFCAETEFTKFVPKDLRRTAKTLMGEIGLSKDIRDKIQNHAQSDVSAKHYDRYAYLAEKRQALDAWGVYLMNLLNNKNVVPLRA